jgi:hypothetical protein
MLKNRRTFIQTTQSQTRKWFDDMRALSPSDRDAAFPAYYDTSFILRNLDHPMAAHVEKAGDLIYGLMHSMERDQFVAPYCMWKALVNSSMLAVISADLLHTELEHCRASTHSHAKPHQHLGSSSDGKARSTHAASSLAEAWKGESRTAKAAKAKTEASAK